MSGCWMSISPVSRTSHTMHKSAASKRSPHAATCLSPAEISAAIAEMLSAWGSIDILVNNAGVAYYGPTEKMTAQQWDWLLAINLLAPIQITRELLPVLMGRD